MSANKPSIGLVVSEIKFDSLEATLGKIWLYKTTAQELIFIEPNPIVTYYDVCYLPLASKYEILLIFILNGCS